MDEIFTFPATDDPIAGRTASLLALGTDPIGLAEVAETGLALGLVIETGLLDEAGLRRLDAAPANVTTALVIGDGGREIAEEALAIVRHRAARRLPVLIIAGIEAIDMTHAAADHAGITLLCDPSATDLATALALLFMPSSAQVRSTSPVSSLHSQLRQLSEQMNQIARALASLSVEEGSGGTSVSAHIPPYSAPKPPSSGAPMNEVPAQAEGDAAHIRAIIRGRRLRDGYFAADLFADPAWDMLLDLTAARLEGRDVAVSSLCIAAAVPPTTALRWIKTLTDAGTFVRVADPQDGRRVFITLSDRAADAMLNYLAAARRMASPVM